MAEKAALEEQLSTLWDAVLNLALPASEQLAILEAIGDSRAVDELALDYDDTCWIITEAASRNALTQEEISALRALDHHLDQISGEANAGNWTIEALRSSDCWKKVRALAATALAERQIVRARRAAA